jgi:hypothetical protein
MRPQRNHCLAQRKFSSLVFRLKEGFCGAMQTRRLGLVSTGWTGEILLIFLLQGPSDIFLNFATCLLGCVSPLRGDAVTTRLRTHHSQWWVRAQTPGVWVTPERNFTTLCSSPRVVVLKSKWIQDPQGCTYSAWQSPSSPLYLNPKKRWEWLTFQK